jgi:2,3,4,5-tetrahydropyridine-2-carboxylate N-succinyltransferase
MRDSQLETIINEAWEKRDSIDSNTKGDFRDSVEEALNLMDSGAERVASPMGDHQWNVNQWLKKSCFTLFQAQRYGFYTWGANRRVAWRIKLVG